MALRTPKKQVSKQEGVIIHPCSENERIKRIELILVGNGDPKAGYVYKVMEMGDEVKTINEKLTGISAVVKELHEKSIGMNAIEKTEKDLTKEKRENITMWIKTLSFIIAAIGLGLTAYFGYTNHKVPAQLEATKSEIKTEIQNMDGISKTTRSGYVRFNDFGFTDSIKVK